MEWGTDRPDRTESNLQGGTTIPPRGSSSPVGVSPDVVTIDGSERDPVQAELDSMGQRMK